MKRLGVVANLQRAGADKVVDRVEKWCKTHDVPLCLCERSKKLITGSENIACRSKLTEKSDVILSMGGDGTLLATARLVGKSGIPILGINIGSLGFLTEQTPANLEQTMDRIVEGDYTIQDRLVLKAQILGRESAEPVYALNDVVIGQRDIRMINLELYSNDDYICSYAGDGLIISTPTGSTAYSLAVGGSILNPDMDAIIASPIAPHSLTSRPLIFTADETLTLRLQAKTSTATMTVDGQVTTELRNSHNISVKKGDYYVKLVRFKENSFYKVLRSKLHWGVLPTTDSSSED